MREAPHEAQALAEFARHTFLRWGAGGLLVVGARHLAPLVIIAADDSMLVIDGAKRHALGALIRSGAAVLKTIRRDPSAYGRAYVACTVLADGSIDIEACGGAFERVPHVERLTPNKAKALRIISRAASYDWPRGFPGVRNLSRRL